MIRRMGLLSLIVCIMILSGCNKPKVEKKDPEVSTSIPPAPEDSEKLKGKDVDKKIPISPPDLSTEQGINKYLVGEWFYSKEYMTDIVCNMNIDKDLNVQLSFHNARTNESKGDYKGQIKFDRLYANDNEVPDLISIELMDTNEPGGDFFFLHRTIYDKKRVMSLFFAGNGNCIFDILGDGESEYTTTEMSFEKLSGEISKLSARKNEEFYAVFWGHGVHYKSIWIDDVQWTPPEEDNFAQTYPVHMTLYGNDKTESVLYNIAPDTEIDILGDDMFKGEVYFVKTDKQGNVIELINAEYKRYIENNLGDDVDSEIQDLIFDIIINEVEEIKEYLDIGMTILFDGEMTTIDGEDCYEVILGTDHEEHFVKEVFYAVNISEREIHRYDALNDKWEPVPKG